MKCALYVRVSTEEQAKEGFSIPAQRERLKSFCDSQGWEIVEEYVEEGWSAKDIQRPKMQKMLKDIEKKKFDIVLVYKLDRLTRSVLDLYLLLQLFDKNNVAFRSATEVYDTSTAMGRLFITLVAALAQWERENLAERVKFGMEQMIEQGKKPGGHSPYGYDFGPNFECTILEDESQIVNDIFNWYADGFGYKAIAKRLNELNVKPKWSDKWNHVSISDILRNDMYIGIYRWGNKVRYSNHTPIVSDILFKRVQKKIETNQRPERRGSYPLTGILVCGNCDKNKINGFFDKRDKKTYYRCTNCNRITNEVRILEPLFDELELLITSKEYFMSKINVTTEQEVDLKKITEQINKIQKQKEKWYNVFMSDDNPIPQQVLFAKISALNKQEEELQIILDDHDIVEETPEEKYRKIKQLKDIKKHYFNTDVFRQKELLQSIFEEVSVSRERGKLQNVELQYILK